ncbi:hypothetical protein CR513_03787, partial [Mucuna pruriens]
VYVEEPPFSALAAYSFKFLNLSRIPFTLFPFPFHQTLYHLCNFLLFHYAILIKFWPQCYFDEAMLLEAPPLAHSPKSSSNHNVLGTHQLNYD